MFRMANIFPIFSIIQGITWPVEKVGGYTMAIITAHVLERRTKSAHMDKSRTWSRARLQVL